jgi:hypothetical protein
VEVRPAGELADDDRLEGGEAGGCGGDPREDLGELELVMEVVLEPEDDVPPVGERLVEGAIPVLEAWEHGCGAPVVRADPAELMRGKRRHRSLVEHVLPREELALEVGRLHRPDDAEPVRDVEGQGASSRSRSIQRQITSTT